MSEEAIVDEVSTEVDSQVDSGGEEIGQIVTEEPSPELDLTDVFEESTGSTDSFGDRVREAGVDYGEDNPSDALLGAYNQAQEYNTQWQDYYRKQQEYQQQVDAQQQYERQQMQQMAEYGQAQYQQQQAIEAQQQMQMQQQMAQQQEYQRYQDEQDERWWTPPEIDKEYISKFRSQFQDPETGEIYWDWAENTPNEVIDAATDYVEYHKEWDKAIRERPHEVLPEVIEKEFDRLFVDRYGKLMDEYREEQTVRQQHSEVESINDRNADWMYQQDPRTGQTAVGYDGEPVLTQQGEKVIGHINSLRQSGMTNPKQLWDTASRLLAGEMAQGALTQTQQQMQYMQQNQQRNMRHLQSGVRRIENRNGSEAPRENPSRFSQNINLSPGDKLRQQALADGLF